MKLFTIGFTKKSAQEFFSRLQDAGVKKVIDIRLNNKSQLAGFAKQDDLQFFLKAIAGMEYIRKAEWAPTQEILDDYKKRKGSWTDYEKSFTTLMRQRKVEMKIDPVELDNACLLCSEDRAEKCHRRLVAEYFRDHFKGIEICHL